MMMHKHTHLFKLSVILTAEDSVKNDARKGLICWSLSSEIVHVRSVEYSLMQILFLNIPVKFHIMINYPLVHVGNLYTVMMHDHRIKTKVAQMLREITPVKLSFSSACSEGMHKRDKLVQMTFCFCQVSKLQYEVLSMYCMWGARNLNYLKNDTSQQQDT